MLSQIGLQNFKAFRSTGQVPLKPLTVLFGANNSGKSSLLHSLLALKQTLQGRDTTTALVTSGERIDLGSFHELRHTGAQEGDSVKIHLLLDDNESQRPPNHLLPDTDDNTDTRIGLDISFRYDADRNRILLSSSRITYGERGLAGIARAGSGYRPLDLPGEYTDFVRVTTHNFLPRMMLKSAAPEDSELASDIMDAEFRWRLVYQLWLGALGPRLRHVSPLRQSIPRYSVRGEAPGEWVGVGGSTLIRDLRSEMKVTETKTLLEFLRHWICDHFGLLDNIVLQPVDEPGRVVQLMGRESAGPPINVASMGSGISQLLPIIAAVGETSRGECLLVEQPEIHLHPAAQSDIADVFIDGVVNRRGQYIVETHSEHILLRLRRRIAEGVVKPEQVSVLYISREQGAANIRTVGISDKGELSGWPDDFFAEDYFEARALSIASQKGGD